MKIIFSKLEECMLHIVHRKSDFYEKDVQRRDIVEPDQYIQLSALKMKNETTFRPHAHIWKEFENLNRDKNRQTIAQESWVVVRGKVKCFFYDLDDTLLEEVVLEEGDCSITLQGGHNYEILEDDTLVYEYKTGPYLGQANDKRFLHEED